MKKDYLLYFVFKSFSLISFVFTTPILLSGLGDSEFGVWSTISSFITWILVLDFGIGNYLRNRVSELSITDPSHEIIKEYAKGLIISASVAVAVCISLMGATVFINWQDLLGISSSGPDPFLPITCIILFTSFSFVSNLIFFYYYGLQKSYLVALMQSSSHLLFIFTAVLLNAYQEMSLLRISIAFGLSQVLPGALASIRFFAKNDLPKYLRPLPSMRDSSLFLKIGGRFFLIQLTALILFSTDKVLLANLFGPSKVTDYEIVFRVFSLCVLFQSLLLTPAWGKYSRDYFSGRLSLVRKQLIFHGMIFALLTLVTLVLGFFMNPILSVWVGETVQSETFIVALLIYVILMIWNNVYAILLNATNNIDLTFKISIVVVVLNLPISYSLAQTELREVGVILGTILCLLPAAIFTPIQTYYLLRAKDNA